MIINYVKITKYCCCSSYNEVNIALIHGEGNICDTHLLLAC